MLQEITDTLNKRDGEYAAYTYNPQFKSRDKENEKLGQGLGKLLRDAVDERPETYDEAVRVLHETEKLSLRLWRRK